MFSHVNVVEIPKLGLTGLNNKKHTAIHRFPTMPHENFALKRLKYDQRSLPGVYYAAKPINSRS